jgi:hypothetical protein
LDVEDDKLTRRVSHERNRPNKLDKNPMSHNINFKNNNDGLSTTTAKSNYPLNEMFSASSEAKKNNYISDEYKEEILLESMGSGGTSGISVEAYPRLMVQDYQNVALLVVLCK